VLPDTPLGLIGQGLHNDVPLVVGANADETSMDVPPSLTEPQYELLVQSAFGPFADEVLGAYPVAEYGDAASAFLHLTTDLKFVCTARNVARVAAAGGSSPVFHYHFAEGFDTAALEAYGAYHGAELAYVFGFLDELYFLSSPPAAEAELADAIQDYWATFAATGEPAAGELPAWPAYDPADDESLVLEGGDIRVEAGIRAAQCDFWEDLFPF
jgi:para-nitrobenzyl esterase